MIHQTYLPYTREELEPHFLTNIQRNIDYFERSASRYKNFLEKNSVTAGIPITTTRLPRQIEKDERFWTAAALKHIFDSTTPSLVTFLSKCFGDSPPTPHFSKWEDCLNGELVLYFEVKCPAPKLYREWLSKNLPDQHLIPYVFDAVKNRSGRSLEGPTRLDALFLNPSNGFAVLIETKVMSDISVNTTFDCRRNQLARTIDILLEEPSGSNKVSTRNPSLSLFCLLTPKMFKNHPQSRHYAQLMNDYKTCSNSLIRDLPHRDPTLLKTIPDRIGWITFEEISDIFPEACPWLKNENNS